MLAICSNSAFSHMGEWGDKTRFGATTCAHIMRNSGWHDLASLSFDYTQGGCIATDPPIEPCHRSIGTNQVTISINKNNPSPKVKTQIITSNDWIKQENPSFPITMIFNSTLKRGQTLNLEKIMAAPRSIFVCRIGN